MAITIDLNEQERGRRESLAKLRELGINPYPAPLYPVDTTTAEIEAGFDPEKGNFENVCLAGRIMSRRIMGAASFMELQDHAGRIQVYVKRDEICPGEDKTLYNTVFKKLRSRNSWTSATSSASRVSPSLPRRASFPSMRKSLPSCPSPSVSSPS